MIHSDSRSRDREMCIEKMWANNQQERERRTWDDDDDPPQYFPFIIRQSSIWDIMMNIFKWTCFCLLPLYLSTYLCRTSASRATEKKDVNSQHSISSSSIIMNVELVLWCCCCWHFWMKNNICVFSSSFERNENVFCDVWVNICHLI